MPVRKGSLNMAQARPQYTAEQRTFMVLTYNRTENMAETLQLFEEHFPDVRQPCRSTVVRNYQKYRQHGTSLNRNKGNSGRPRTVRSEEGIAEFRQSILQDPHQTKRRNNIGVGPTSFSRLVHEIKFHPYKMQVRHGLIEPDYQRRVDYCEFFLHDNRKSIIIGDEVKFPLNGKVNTQNVREYSQFGNPPLDFNADIRTDVRDSLHCWCGLTTGGVLLGPHYFEGNMNGQMYLEMINDFVLPECERLGVDTNDHWWFQDGCPAHRARIVRDRLQEIFPGRVVGLGHPIEYPPRSPDLTALDFFLWGYVKSIVYVPPFAQNLNTLQERMDEALRNVPRDIRSMQDMYRRAEVCVQQGGGHVEGRIAN